MHNFSKEANVQTEIDFQHFGTFIFFYCSIFGEILIKQALI